MATHADVARRLLGDADPGEAAALGGFDYNRNEVVLHTDARVMPRRRAAWSSWNVDQVACDPPGRAVTMTYHMNRLQALPGPVDYFVSVNPGDRVRDERVIVGAVVRATRSTRSGRSTRRPPSTGSRAIAATWYAGAHLGFGFHEDGCRSGFDAAALIGTAEREAAA